jgi:predicted dinucleotide-binding enzyme
LAIRVWHFDHFDYFDHTDAHRAEERTGKRALMVVHIVETIRKIASSFEEIDADLLEDEREPSLDRTDWDACKVRDVQEARARPAVAHSRPRGVENLN